MMQTKLLAALPGLNGKVLGCWCKPEPCHRDVLMELLSLTHLGTKIKSFNFSDEEANALNA
jgi:Domain of unknown function (DUF4326)